MAQAKPVAHNFMSASVDIERLQKVFGGKGERIVIVVPGQEPLVMLPLNEYEQISAGKKTQVNKSAETKAGKLQLGQQQPKPDAPELVDPLSGGLTDDDQYFPEPL